MSAPVKVYGPDDFSELVLAARRQLAERAKPTAQAPECLHALRVEGERYGCDRPRWHGGSHSSAALNARWVFDVDEKQPPAMGGEPLCW